MAKQIVEIKGLDEFKNGLSDLQLEQYPFAMKEAINEMSGIVLKGEQQQISSDMDRPTPFTVNALKINYATKTNLSGGVVFKDPARLSPDQHYIYPNVFGGDRGFKKFEGAMFSQGLMPLGHVAVPGKSINLDAFGNVPSSKISEILAYFGAKAKNNTTAATKTRKAKGTRRTYGYEYFVQMQKRGGFLPGIYRRTYTTFGTAIDPMFIYVPRFTIRYQQQYKFHDTGRNLFNQYFRQTFNEKLDLAMRTAFK